MALRRVSNLKPLFKGAISQYLQLQPTSKTIFTAIPKPNVLSFQPPVAQEATDIQLQTAIALMTTSYDYFTLFWPKYLLKQTLPVAQLKQNIHEIVKDTQERERSWGEYMCLGGDLMQALNESARLRDLKLGGEEQGPLKQGAKGHVKKLAELVSKNSREQAMKNKERKLEMLKREDFREKDLPLFLS